MLVIEASDHGHDESPKALAHSEATGVWFHIIELKARIILIDLSRVHAHDSARDDYTELMMSDRQIVISEPNARVLRSLLRTRSAALHDQEHLEELRVELDRALVLDPSEMSPTVVTMQATVQVRDLESGRRQELTLVSPGQADVNAGRISVLAPLGTALLGYREGDVVERHMPGGLRRLLIEEVLQAPATGAESVTATQDAVSVH